MSNRAPLAVRRPLNTPPYQEAMPCSISAASRSAGFCGASEAGVAFATGAAMGAIAWLSFTSACTVRAVNETARAARATDVVPASNQIRSGGFELVLLENLRFSIWSFYQLGTFIASDWRKIHVDFHKESLCFMRVFAIFPGRVEPSFSPKIVHS